MSYCIQKTVSYIKSPLWTLGYIVILLLNNKLFRYIAVYLANYVGNGCKLVSENP